MFPLLKPCHVAGAFPPFEAQMVTSYKNANGIIMGKLLCLPTIQRLQLC